MKSGIKDRSAIIALLNRILEMELAGAVRYTHYSFMIFGHSRIPIVSWLRAQADEALVHAHRAGELVTHFGEHPSLGIGPLPETHNHDIEQIMRESLEVENQTLPLYKDLLKLAEGNSVLLEEYARELITAEELHLGEVDKMLRKPGEVGRSAARKAME